MNDTGSNLLAASLLSLFMCLLALLIYGGAFDLLWNCILTDVFSLPTITFWQSVGIVLMGRILFGDHAKVSASND